MKTLQELQEHYLNRFVLQPKTIHGKPGVIVTDGGRRRAIVADTEEALITDTEKHMAACVEQELQRQSKRFKAKEAILEQLHPSMHQFLDNDMAENKQGDIRVRLEDGRVRYSFLTADGFWLETPSDAKALTIHTRDGGIKVEHLDE